jgi:hypothetical protein
MLQELTGAGAGAWATASMLFFIAVYIAVTVRALRARPDELDAKARLVLEGDDDEAADADRTPARMSGRANHG